MLTIIIPAYNEEENIAKVLDKLLNQDNKSLIIGKYKIIVVISKKSNDKTEKIVRTYMKKEKNIPIYITHDHGTGFVDARLAGINYILENLDGDTKYIAFCDADLIVSNNWVNDIISNFSAHDYDVISFAGTFPLEFWKRVPKLAKKYYEEIGTIFFDRKTIEFFKFDSNCLFNEELFQRFGRPVSGGCYAIKKDKYLDCGGYIKEFKDKEKKCELDGPTWRMLFRLYKKEVKIGYSNFNEFSCSPRRLLANPSEFFAIKKYDQMNSLDNYRYVTPKSYDYLEFIADNINFKPVKMYVIEYYIFLWLINDRNLLINNKDFFGNIYDDIYKELNEWDNNQIVKDSISIFNLSKKLREKYGNKLIKILLNNRS